MTSPVVSRRQLAAELRRLRRAAGRTLEQAAAHLECSPAKISRIEGGHVGVRVQDARDLAEFYGLPVADRDALLDLARQARMSGWWDAYSDFLLPATRTLIGMQEVAATIGEYGSYLVPGLLQTADYARAIQLSWPDATPEQVERGVEVRLRRQQVLDRPTGPRFDVVIDESVLLRGVGGAAVMAGQLDHLIEMASRPTVSLQVLPFAAGADAVGNHTFTILSFSSLAEPRVVYTELLSESFWFSNTERIGPYLALFDRLRGHALDPPESVQLIRRVRAG